MTGVASGSATITSTSNKDTSKSATAAVTVVKPNQLPIVKISATKVKVSSGEKITIFIDELNDPDGNVANITITWTLINVDSGDDLSGALQISDTFATFTAPLVIASTQLRINAEADDGQGGKASSSVIITIDPLAAGEAILILNKEVVSVPEGETETITATSLTENGVPDTIIIVPSNPDVATVSVGQLDEDDQTWPIIITGVSKGSTTVVITSGSGLTKTVAVAVTQIGESSLILDKTAVSTVLGETAVVNAIAIKADGSEDTINVESLDTAIATASAFGNTVKIDGVSVGSTTVIVSSGSGLTETIAVSVI